MTWKGSYSVFFLKYKVQKKLVKPVGHC